jgi:hypothetical protein
MTKQAFSRNEDGTLIAYAWPGGYPVFYIARQGFLNDETGEVEVNPYDQAEFAVCPVCANKAQDEQIVIMAQDVHYEGAPITCECCNAEIKSAYGDPEVDNE